MTPDRDAVAVLGTGHRAQTTRAHGSVADRQLVGPGHGLWVLCRWGRAVNGGTHVAAPSERASEARSARAGMSREPRAGRSAPGCLGNSEVSVSVAGDSGHEAGDVRARNELLAAVLTGRTRRPTRFPCVYSSCCISALCGKRGVGLFNAAPARPLAGGSSGVPFSAQDPAAR